MASVTIAPEKAITASGNGRRAPEPAPDASASVADWLAYLSSLGANTPPPPAVHPPSCVYFAEDPATERIKIGVSSNVRQRLYLLKSRTGISARFLGAVAGDRIVEARLHKRFSAYREQGEWFRGAPDLRAWIAEHAEYRTIPVMPDQLPRPTRVALSDDTMARAEAFFARFVAEDGGDGSSTAK